MDSGEQRRWIPKMLRQFDKAADDRADFKAAPGIEILQHGGPEGTELARHRNACIGIAQLRQPDQRAHSGHFSHHATDQRERAGIINQLSGIRSLGRRLRFRLRRWGLPEAGGQPS